MTTRKMKKIEFHVLASDLDAVLAYLGKREIFQIDYPPKREDGEKAGPKAEGSPDREDETAIRELESIRSYLGLDGQDSRGQEPRLPGQAERDALERLKLEVKALRAKEGDARAKLASVREALEESRAFAKLKVPYTELELLTFIVMRTGRIEGKNLEGLRAALGDRGVVIPLDGSGRIAALSSKKGRFALDTELKNSGFVPIELPVGFKGVPDGLIEALEEEERQAARVLDLAIAEREGCSERTAPVLPNLLLGFGMASAIEKARHRLESTELAYRLSGWTPKDSLAGLVEELGKLTEGRIAIRSYDPEELPDVRKGTVKVPVSVRHGKLVGSYEKLVFSYGTPLYGTIDPTPLVAFFFILLFSIMFGDLGQGGVLLGVGLWLAFSKKGPFRSWTQFAPIFISIGIGSMTMGLLDGSIFSDERLLIPATRAVTKALLGFPMDRIITLMPTEGVGKILAFFLFTIAVGVAINSIGLVVNMINLFRLRHFGKLLFSKTGLAGSLFFWYAIGIGARLGLKQPLFWWDSILPGLCLVCLFLGESLEHLMEGKPPFPDGILSFVIQGLVEIIESVSYYASNTVSFLRVGAFALSHAVLSFIVFAMGDMVRTGASALGPAMQLLVIIIGNVVIIVLEGMVVAIQVIRLQYYEFFSKFFSETGLKFKPFSFSANR
jgi:V/A-type H+-transporting ATPase subunit I